MLLVVNFNDKKGEFKKIIVLSSFKDCVVKWRAESDKSRRRSE